MRPRVAAALASLLLALPSSAALYEFVEIASTGAQVCGLAPQSASMNDAGVVAFAADVSASECNAQSDGQVLRGDGSGAPLVLDAAQATQIIETAIDSSGRVVYSRSDPLGVAPDALVIADEQGVSPIYSAAPGLCFRGPRVNDAGTVAFYCVGNNIRTGTLQGGELTTYAVEGGILVGRPELAQNGMLAALGVGPLTGEHVLYRGANGAFVRFADNLETSPFVSLIFGVSINDLGIAAFGATFRAAPGAELQSGIYTNDGVANALLLDSSGGFGAFATPRINDAGDVVFEATTDDDHLGIFVGPDPVADVLIRVGDTLFGQKVVDDVALRLVEHNDAGQILFFAALETAPDESRRVLVRADPVPEAGAVACGIAALAALAARGARRR